MPRARSSGSRSASTPVSACTSAVLPWSMCPAVPSVSGARSRPRGADGARGQRRPPRPSACAGRAAARPSAMRATTGGSPRRSAAASAPGSPPSSATAGPGQLEQRQRPAADAGDRLDDGPAGRAASALARARAASPRRPSSIASTGSSRRASAGSRCRRSVASSAASESLSIRSARASGCAAAGRDGLARPTSRPACGPPSSLSPLRGHERGAGAHRAADGRLVGEEVEAVVGEDARADVVDDGHAERAEGLDLRPPRRSRRCGSSTGARGGSRRSSASRARPRVVGQARAVGRPDLDEARAGLGDDLGDAEAAADLDELAARDDQVAPGRERRGGQQRRAPRSC